MNLNFFKLLSQNEGSADQIAQEIILIEKNITEHKEQDKLLKEESRNLRARQLCGEAVSPVDVRRVKEQLEQVEEDLGVFTESHEKLTAKLIQVLKENNKEGWAQLQSDVDSFEEEERKEVEEIVKLKAKLIVLEGSISDRGRNLFIGQEFTRFCNLEQKRLRVEMPRPTYFDRRVQLDKRKAQLNQFKVEDEIKRLLNQYQSGVEVTAD